MYLQEIFAKASCGELSCVKLTLYEVYYLAFGYWVKQTTPNCQPNFSSVTSTLRGR